MMVDEFYLQDSRDLADNQLLFWRKGSRGYTIDLSDAEIFTRSSVITRNLHRDTDIPWPRDYIDSLGFDTVDVHCVDIDDALNGIGIELSKPMVYDKFVYRCGGGYGGCGRIMSEISYYSSVCINCGTDNRP